MIIDSSTPLLIAVAVVAAVIVVLAFPLLIQVGRTNGIPFLAAALIVAAFVPYWKGLPLPGNLFLPAVVIVLIVCLFALLVTSRGGNPRWPDMLVVFVVIAMLAAVIVAGVTPGAAIAITVAWFIPYLFGRIVAPRVTFAAASMLISGVAAVVAIWAVLELVLNMHLFAGDPSSIWSSIQYRAGLARSEGAMGTSIVLGNALAMAVPFVVLAPLGPFRRVLILGLIMAGILTTFSRNALLAFGLAVVLTFLVGKFSAARARSRPVAFLGIFAAFMFAVVPFLTSLGDSAGQELSNSTQYRTGYLSLLSGIQLLGPSSSRVVLPNGNAGYLASGYQGGVVLSVDSTPLYLALEFGWIPAALLTALILGLTLLALRRSSTNAALIAVASMTPTVFTLAMVTQFPTFYWMLVGAGVASWSLRSKRQAEERHVALEPLAARHPRVLTHASAR